jgi:O-antigen/teichoic acid export membrane protein
VQFLAGVSLLSLNNVLLRFLPVAGSATFRLIRSSYLVSGMTAAAVGLVFIAGTGIWSPALTFLRSEPAWLISFVVATSAYTIFALQDSVLVGMRRAIWVPVENGISSLLRVVLLLILAGSFIDAGIFASWNLPVALAVVVVTYFILGRLADDHAATTVELATPLSLRRLGRYALGDYVGALMWRAAGSLIPILVLNRLGAAENAYFFLPWVVFGAIQFAVIGSLRSLTVEAAMDQARIRSYCRRMMVQMLGMILPVVVVLALEAPRLLQLFGSDYAREGESLLRWLAFASIPAAIVTLALSIARVQERPRILALVSAGAAIPLLSLSYVLLPDFGIRAVGIAALITYASLASVLLATMLRPLLFQKDGAEAK